MKKLLNKFDFTLNKKYFYSFLSLFFLLQTVPTANASVLYDEALSGDLNGSIQAAPYLSPGTNLGLLQIGTNSILGNFGFSTASSGDDDIFTFTVPDGHMLSAIILSQYQAIGGGTGNGSYFGLNDGTYVGTGLSSSGDNLTDALINTTGDILDDFISGPYAAGTGIDGPLLAGTYSLFLSEISGSINYQLDLSVTAVPVPAAVWLFGSALFGLLGFKRH